MVKGISQFFYACDFVDRWVHESLTPDSLSNISSINSIERQPRTFPSSNYSISSSYSFNARQIFSGREIRINCDSDSNLVGCAQPLEGVDFRVNRRSFSSYHSKTSLEGAYSIDIRANKSSNQIKRNKCFVSSPLECAAIYLQNNSQSDLSWFNYFNVTFFWLLTAVVKLFLSFIYLIGVFSISNIICVHWGLIF